MDEERKASRLKSQTKKNTHSIHLLVKLLCLKCCRMHENADKNRHTISIFLVHTLFDVSLSFHLLRLFFLST